MPACPCLLRSWIALLTVAFASFAFVGRAEAAYEYDAYVTSGDALTVSYYAYLYENVYNDYYLNGLYLSYYGSLYTEYGYFYSDWYYYDAYVYHSYAYQYFDYLTNFHWNGGYYTYYAAVYNYYAALFSYYAYVT